MLITGWRAIVTSWISSTIAPTVNTPWTVETKMIA